ncbi:MAG: bacterial transcriptional activator domain-containing protein [Rubrivivax sp.]
MSAITRTAPAARRRAAQDGAGHGASGARLALLGEPHVAWGARRSAPWPYAKLPALLLLLASDGRAPVRRDWVAALLWPDGDGSSLRRAWYELRHHLRDEHAAQPLLLGTRTALQLAAPVRTDLDLVDAAYRSMGDGAPLDVDRAEQAMRAWRGELAQGLAIGGADEFELWLQQMRARWQHRALSVADALAEHHLARGAVHDALRVGRLAVERAFDHEAAHAIWWRCLVAGDARALAVEDYRVYREQLAALQLRPSASLHALATELGLVAAAAPAAQPSGAGARELADALNQLLRDGDGLQRADALLEQSEPRLLRQAWGMPTSDELLLLRRALMLRLMIAPWHAAMARLATAAERLLGGSLSLAERLDLVQPLAIWHGWMGRGLRGEVLLRGLGEPEALGALAGAARVRFEMTLSLCHSCSTGDPERSIQAARRGLSLARRHQVPGCEPALQILIANAALNRAGPGDAEVAGRALERARAGGRPLQRFDEVNHLQVMAQWHLAHGEPAQALAHAEEGCRRAAAMPFPLQHLSCQLAGAAARMLMDDDEGLDLALASAVDVARRIGSQGYLANALLLAGAMARRRGQPRAAQALAAEALALVRRFGMNRLRKIPGRLRDEALMGG